MSQVKLTKNELRVQQIKLQQLSRYLPTLQLKKAMLQQEVNLAMVQIEEKNQNYQKSKDLAFEIAQLFNESGMNAFYDSLKVRQLIVTQENIAGLDVPVFEDVLFEDVAYKGASVPLWWDYALVQMKNLIKEKEQLTVLKSKRKLLEKELKEVSIRVNLFEKVLIPRAIAAIKKIKIFLGDLQLSAVAQAKVAKAKIEMKRKAFEGAL